MTESVVPGEQEDTGKIGERQEKRKKEKGKRKREKGKRKREKGKSEKEKGKRNRGFHGFSRRNYQEPTELDTACPEPAERGLTLVNTVFYSPLTHDERQ
jgi:hypothetical protein